MAAEANRPRHRVLDRGVEVRASRRLGEGRRCTSATDGRRGCNCPRQPELEFPCTQVGNVEETRPWTASTTSPPSRWKAAYATLPPTVPGPHDVALAVLHPLGPLGTLRLGNHTHVGELRILRRPSDDWRRTVTSPQTLHDNCDEKERNAAGARCFERVLRQTITRSEERALPSTGQLLDQDASTSPTGSSTSIRLYATSPIRSCRIRPTRAPTTSNPTWRAAK
jgi:hypothetical protein